MLVLSGTAQADRIRVHLTPTAQATARATVLTQTDVGASGNWRGGIKPIDLATIDSEPAGCNYHPRRSDLVLNGAARSEWTYIPQVATVRSEADVLQTEAMVSRDWQRGVVAPQERSCIPASLASGQRLISFGHLAFPRLVARTVAFRAVVDTPVSGRMLRISAVLVVFAVGRTEVSLAVGAPSANWSFISHTALRLARILLAKAGGRVNPQRPPLSPAPPLALRNYARCTGSTPIMPDPSSGPTGTKVTILISPTLAKWHSYSLYEDGSKISSGGGFPAFPINTVIKGKPGQSITFVIVREFAGGGRPCISGTGSFAVTKLGTNPPPPVSPGFGSCPQQTTITLSQTSGPSPSPITISLPPPADNWEGFYIYQGTGTIASGGGYPSTPVQVVVKGAVGQQIVFTLVRGYTNGTTIQATCTAASAVFTITR